MIDVFVLCLSASERFQIVILVSNGISPSNPGTIIKKKRTTLPTLKIFCILTLKDYCSYPHPHWENRQKKETKLIPIHVIIKVNPDSPDPVSQSYSSSPPQPRTSVWTSGLFHCFHLGMGKKNKSLHKICCLKDFINLDNRGENKKIKMTHVLQ